MGMNLELKMEWSMEMTGLVLCCIGPYQWIFIFQASPTEYTWKTRGGTTRHQTDYILIKV